MSPFRKYFWSSSTGPATILRFKSTWQILLKCLLGPGPEIEPEESADILEVRQPDIRYGRKRSLARDGGWEEMDEGLDEHGRQSLATKFMNDSGKAFPTRCANRKPKISSTAQATIF
jgi:hypothetical protein